MYARVEYLAIYVAYKDRANVMIFVKYMISEALEPTITFHYH